MSRMGLILVGLLYPGWGLFLRLTVPEVFRDEPIPGRIVIGAIAVILFGASYLVKHVKLVRLSAITMLYAVCLNYFLILHEHHENGLYVVGAFITVLVCGAIFESRRALAVFLIFNMIMTFFSLSGALDQVRYFLQGGMFTIATVSYLTYGRRLRLLESYQEALQIIEDQQRQLLSASRLSALGEMSAGIAHEINNPMNVILLNAGRIRVETRSPKADFHVIREAAERIESTSKRIAKIVTSLRTLSHGGTSERFELTTAVEVVETAMELCAEKIKSSNVEIDCTQVDSEIIFEAKPVQIGQILTNLINNAVDAVLSGSQEKPWIRVETELEFDTLRIAVSDSGPRILPEVMTRIFTPFFTTKAPGKGSGLGLTLSRTFAAQHHGSLFFDPKSEHTRVVLELPIQQPAV